MPDPIEPKEEKKDELAPGTPSPDDTFVGKRDRVKTITQIAKESQARIRKQYLEDLEKKEAEAAKKEEALMFKEDEIFSWEKTDAEHVYLEEERN